MDNYNIYKQYTLDKINNSLTIEQPFYHIFIQDILHNDLYVLLKDKNEYYKQFTSNRLQDNKSFVNNKYSIIDSNDLVLQTFHKLFSDKEIIKSIFNKFFINTLDFLNKISVYDYECEFVYTDANKFQSIHVDIPSKFVSMVFYFPDSVLSDEEQLKNGTVLYDDDIIPVYNSRYLPNSVCIFAPHLYSYHGFHTTIERNSLVLFYVHEDLIKDNLKAAPKTKSNIEIIDFKKSVVDKLKKYRLIEYRDKNLDEESKKSKINYNKGRVVI